MRGVVSEIETAGVGKRGVLSVLEAIQSGPDQTDALVFVGGLRLQPTGADEVFQAFMAAHSVGSPLIASHHIDLFLLCDPHDEAVASLKFRLPVGGGVKRRVDRPAQ